jgi:hypothetical protein
MNNDTTVSFQTRFPAGFWSINRFHPVQFLFTYISLSKIILQIAPGNRITRKLRSSRGLSPGISKTKSIETADATDWNNYCDRIVKSSSWKVRWFVAWFWASVEAHNQSWIAVSTMVIFDFRFAYPCHHYRSSSPISRSMSPSLPLQLQNFGHHVLNRAVLHRIFE